MLPNSAPMFECHFGVPMIGAVLNTLNTRLDAEAIAFMLAHGEAKVLITDPEFSEDRQGRPGAARRAEAAGHRYRSIPNSPAAKRSAKRITKPSSTKAIPDFAWQLPENEWDAIALNYTSGTTGNPKGVVYHHRGAYLNSASNIISWGMPPHSVYLWTLPMFHCNGWCFPWTLAANAGTSVCLRKVDPALIFGLIKEHKVSHMCGAPIVYGMMINAPAALKEGIEHQVNGLIAGAAPAGRHHRRCRADGLQYHPCLRVDRNLRPGFGLRQAPGMGQAADRPARCAQRPSGRALPHAGSDCGDATRSAWSRCPGMAKPWAKSCSAATWS